MTECVYGIVVSTPAGTPPVLRRVEESERDVGVGKNTPKVFGTYYHPPHPSPPSRPSLPLPPSPSLLSLTASIQDVLEVHLSLSDEATPTVVSFDFLQQALSVYVRLALHRGAESEGECDVVRERVREVVEWSDRALLPLLRGET